MAKYKEIQNSLKKDIIEVLRKLQNKGLRYKRDIVIKGNIDVTIDNKKVFVIKIQETISKDISSDGNCESTTLSSQIRRKKLHLDKTNFSEEIENFTIVSTEKGNSVNDSPLAVLPDDVTAKKELTGDAVYDQYSDTDGSNSCGITEDCSPKVKTEVEFEPLAPIQALNASSEEVQEKTESPRREVSVSKKKMRKLSKKKKCSSQGKTDFRDPIQCAKCLRTFRTKNLQAKHACRSRCSLVCEVCEVRFRSRQALKKHKIASHFSENGHSFDCVVCGSKFGSPSQLRKHRLKHADPTAQNGTKETTNSDSSLSFYCFICHVPFKNRHSLDKHEIANHFPDEGHPFKCGSCGARFGCTAHLSRHRKSHTGRETFSDYVCKECGMKFEREASLKKHQGTHVPRVVTYACQYCEELFCTQYEMRTHTEELHEKLEKKYLCLYCENQFETGEEKSSHSCVRNIEAGATTYQCRVCARCYDTEQSLILHQASGSNCLLLKNGVLQSVLYCMECNIEYANETELKSHTHVSQPSVALPLHRCHTCGLVCEDETAVRKHRNTFHFQEAEGLFYCPVCPETRESRSSLLAHITTHKDLDTLDESKNQYRCPCCELGFDSKDLLAKHKSLHIKRNECFPCKTCRATFDSQEEVYCHIEVNHLEKRMMYVCGLCSSTFSDLTQLRDHESLKHASIDLPPCVCSICGLRFVSQQSLNEHLKNAECQTCGTMFLAHCHLQHHLDSLVMAKRKQDIPYCIPCGKSFASHVSLMLHERRSHQPEEGHPFKCNECGRRFGNMTHLRRHKMIHTNVKPYLCDHCGKSFRSERSCSIHDKLFHHDGETHRFQCIECNKKFGSQQNLDRHVLVHSGFKPHLCVTCGRRFKSKETLRDHDKRVHQGKFEYSCETCGHGFKTEFKLQLHVLMHQQHTDFKCQRCDHQYNSMAELMSHHNKEHPDFVSEKKVQCGICGARYPDTNQLHHHQSSHLPTKMFKCEMCEATFQHKTSLFRHRSKRCPNRKEKEPLKSRPPKVPRVKVSKKQVLEEAPPPQQEPNHTEQQRISLQELQPVPIACTEVVASNNVPVFLHGLQEPVTTYRQMTLEVPVVPPHQPQNTAPWEPHLQQQQNMMHFHSMPTYRHPTQPPPHPYGIGQQFPLHLPGQPHIQPR